MTARATTTVDVQVASASRTIPSELHIGTASLSIWTHEGRLRARWTRGEATGGASLEIVPGTPRTSQIVLELDPPAGMSARLGWLFEGRRLATQFVQALGYEIVTRTGDLSDAFTVRRTTPELVKQRAS